MTAALRGAIVGAALVVLLAGCGGGGAGNNGSLQVPSPNALSVADVQQIIAQAVAEAQARNAQATIAVIDRVGNVLGIFKMSGAAATFTISGAKGAVGGLEGVNVLPPEFGAVPKAFTAAYFSSAGNAFSSRSAAQIIQEHFNPLEFDQPAGPLFGVQFSQLTCSDVSRRQSDGTIGTKRSPLGFGADPGGLPLYKNGAVVGAVGVIAGNFYSVDRNVIDVDTNIDELIAVAGTVGFAAPTAIRADHIALDGRTLRFTDSEALLSNPATAPPFGSINGVVGALVNLPLYGGNPIVPGTVYGTSASGVRPDTNPAFAGLNAWAVVDASDSNRFPPRAGTDGLMTAAEVTQIMKSALEVANHTRTQVRQPVGSTAQVTIAIVDTNGEIVGLTRQPDALVDAIDAVPQKARTALFFSSSGAAAALIAAPPAMYLDGTVSPIGAYVTAAQAFFNDPTIFANGIAFSSRSIGNISAPFFPDGIQGTANGPFAKPYANWSIFNNGLELDLVYNQLVAPLLKPTDPTILTSDCTGIKQIRNGITLFGGGFPIFRGTQLVGAIGASGDGTDQSDLIAFLGLNNAGQALQTGIGNAPAAQRADQLVPQGQGTRLRYVNCPTAPFIDSTAQNVCAGL
ncbi:MAG TPA: heme-binding protein [Casimicrobiaceae bacterium]|nr:heme-binding protein [Casimicrobiaceae bacterium]